MTVYFPEKIHIPSPPIEEIRNSGAGVSKAKKLREIKEVNLEFFFGGGGRWGGLRKVLSIGLGNGG